MKTVFILVGLLVSSLAHAGPSVSGGVSQAPGVAAAGVYIQVIELIAAKYISVTAMRTIDYKNVEAEADCGNGKRVKMFFTVEYGCTKTAVMCLPFTNVQLDERNSESCR